MWYFFIIFMEYIVEQEELNKRFRLYTPHIVVFFFLQNATYTYILI